MKSVSSTTSLDAIVLHPVITTVYENQSPYEFLKRCETYLKEMDVACDVCYTPMPAFHIEKPIIASQCMFRVMRQLTTIATDRNVRGWYNLCWVCYKKFTSYREESLLNMHSGTFMSNVWQVGATKDLLGVSYSA